jgi:CSLREA domain-containing protein
MSRGFRLEGAAAALLMACVMVLVPGAPARADHAPPATDIVVGTFEDSYDGSCGDGDCSLRDAVASAGDGETIGLPSGLVGLTLTGTGGIAAGDIDVRRDVTIIGIGQTGTFIDAGAIDDRVFDVHGATVTLERLTLLSGSTTGRGGALAVDGGGSLALELVTVIEGHARSGGGVAVSDASLHVDRSTLLDNVAEVRGGGISAHGTSVVQVVRSTVSGGAARSGGGVAVSSGSTVAVRRSTLAGNSAETGGAIRTSGQDASISSTTIARNTATTAPAILATAQVTIERSLVAENAADRRPCVGDVASAGANVGTRRTVSCGLVRASDRIVGDARMAPLASVGGPTPTIALEPRSPAVDSGRSCRGTDQRGVRRDRRCDAGAYELIRCQRHIVNVVGTTHDDELSGGRRNDGILGRDGDDELQGSIGSDGICGAAGGDRLVGGPGDDHIHGSTGDDRILGEDGDDLLRGGQGTNVLVGGRGRDVCIRGRPGDLVRSCEIVRGPR